MSLTVPRPFARIAIETLFLLALTAPALGVKAQPAWPPISPEVTQAFERIGKHPPVSAAMDALKGASARMFEEQVRLTEIPSPPFKEEARAKYFLGKVREAGLREAYIDKEGNVVALRKGSGGGPKLIASAHLDSVFPEGTDVKVREKDGRYYAPGIYDDALGLATLLMVIEAMEKQRVRTVGDILFVGTVGEEELGDLRGVKALFRDHKDIDGFISFDGLGLGRIVNQGTASRRYLVEFRGPGGHSFAAFGLPSPIHAMGRAIAKIGDLQTPTNPKTTFTVGIVKGGTAVNAIAADATMSVDMRSDSPEELKKVEEQVMAAIRDAVSEENKRWNSNRITVEPKLVGDRPGGTNPLDSRIVQGARQALSAIGGRVTAITAASTDANIALSLGIPAVSFSNAGIGGANHSPGEWYAPVNNWLGPQASMLFILSLVGIDGVSSPLLDRRPSR
jgi:tripeptide aminopeptidase